MKVDIQKTISRGIKSILVIYALVSFSYTISRLYQQDTALVIRSHQNIVFDNKPVQPDGLLQSKMFSATMGYSKITPYYMKATDPIRSKDITLSTLVTRDRFPVLSRLASHYKGPISATVHIHHDDTKTLKELKKWSENEDMRRYVDIHLIIDDYDRQFNLWRNIARLYALTDYVMMLDIDFFPCTDLRQILNDPKLVQRLEQNHALVLPAFEYLEPKDYLEFPRTKQALLKEVELQRVDMFHRDWQRGHGATDYERWYQATSAYAVTDYIHSYEPYVIFKRQGSPWCDERFVGYGANKAACLYEFYISGMSYFVLTDHFLIHQSHPYPEYTRKKERGLNQRIYKHFREEVCLRYARSFKAKNEWNTSRADNLKRECVQNGSSEYIYHAD
ncbi:hypothetical protein G6F56_010555 [Rhizopus delemar]|nr:hypothetical protein G6F56_010555 [Rhizopus delemar]